MLCFAGIYILWLIPSDLLHKSHMNLVFYHLHNVISVRPPENKPPSKCKVDNCSRNRGILEAAANYYGCNVQTKGVKHKKYLDQENVPRASGARTFPGTACCVIANCTDTLLYFSCFLLQSHLKPHLEFYCLLLGILLTSITASSRLDTYFLKTLDRQSALLHPDISPASIGIHNLSGIAVPDSRKAG